MIAAAYYLHEENHQTLRILLLYQFAKEDTSSVALTQKLKYLFPELRPFFQVTQAVLNKRLHIPHFLPAVVAVEIGRAHV